MGGNLQHANAVTPRPGGAWSQISDAERLAIVVDVVTAAKDTLRSILLPIAARPDGQVIVRLLEPVCAGERGTVLLDFEALLKQSIDPGLVVWLEPLEDRSSLRNLRGIEMRS